MNNNKIEATRNNIRDVVDPELRNINPGLYEVQITYKAWKAEFDDIMLAIWVTEYGWMPREDDEST